MSEHFTKIEDAVVGKIRTVEDAIRAHHLATADPEPERDGLMTSEEHEAKYGLDRASVETTAVPAAPESAQAAAPVENTAAAPAPEQA